MNNELKPLENELEPIDEALKKVNEALKDDEELKPINNDFDKELDFLKEEVKEDFEKDKFASNFPEWDLLPSNQVIRRVNRK